MTLDPERLDALEHTIGRLTLELADARRALAALRAESAHGAMPAAPVVRPAPPVPAPTVPGAPRPAPRVAGEARQNQGYEQLVGRYGALALAVLTIVMGAGALVSWAISHGMLGPWVRVTLGALLAIAIAGTGWWMRLRGSRGFGNVLIALSIAVIDVVAWGAGPRLGLIRPGTSLAIVDAAAAAVAALALMENEQLLYAVGVGGALIAPFVMATGESHYGMLAAYGLIVIAAAIRMLGSRPWWRAVWLVVVGTVVYAFSVGGYKSDVLWINREFAPAFAGGICVIALLWERKPARPWIALCAVTTMALVTHRDSPRVAPRLEALFATPDIQLAALTGTALAFAAVRAIDDPEFFSLWALAIIVIPLIFLNAALSPLGSFSGPVSGSVVLVWGLAYSIASLREQGNRRGALITASGLAGLWAITLLLEHAPDAMPPVLAAYAVLLATVSRQEKQPVVLAATGASLFVGFWIAAWHLAMQTGYTQAPFLSVASLGAASAVGAAFLSARVGLPDRVRLFGAEITRDDAGALTASVLAFAWGHLELRRAFSADVSTFLLIAYYASCGVLAIHRGRVRSAGRLRQVGLALAVLAALYALIAASDVAQIGLRVGSYLLVGAFLLGVAWWYRGEVPHENTDSRQPSID